MLPVCMPLLHGHWPRGLPAAEKVAVQACAARANPISERPEAASATHPSVTSSCLQYALPTARHFVSSNPPPSRTLAMQPSTPPADTKCNPIVPPVAPSGPSSPFPIQHAPCAQLQCAWKLTTRLDRPTSTNRRLLTGVPWACPDVVRRCQSHAASGRPSEQPSERHSLLLCAAVSRVPAEHCLQTSMSDEWSSSNTIVARSHGHTATIPPVHASTRRDSPRNSLSATPEDGL